MVCTWVMLNTKHLCALVVISTFDTHRHNKPPPLLLLHTDTAVKPLCALEWRSKKCERAKTIRKRRGKKICKRNSRRTNTQESDGKSEWSRREKKSARLYRWCEIILTSAVRTFIFAIQSVSPNRSEHAHFKHQQQHFIYLYVDFLFIRVLLQIVCVCQSCLLVLF